MFSSHHFIQPLLSAIKIPCNWLDSNFDVFSEAQEDQILNIFSHSQFLFREWLTLANWSSHVWFRILICLFKFSPWHGVNRKFSNYLWSQPLHSCHHQTHQQPASPKGSLSAPGLTGILQRWQTPIGPGIWKCYSRRK